MLLAMLAGQAWAISARGIVTDANGKPVHGVKVFAVQWWYTGEEEGTGTSIKAAVISGPDGLFEFKSLPLPRKKTGSIGYALIAFTPDKYLGWFGGGGKLSAYGNWEQPEPDPYEIMVSRPGVREGRVVDEKGNGIPGVTVWPRGFYTKIREGFGSGVSTAPLFAIVKMNPAVSDDQGYYRLTGIPETARISPGVTCKRYATQVFSHSDPIVMTPGGGVSGRVLDEHGKPLARAFVEAFGIDTGSWGDVKPGTDGSFAIEGLRPGKYGVYARPKERVGVNAYTMVSAGKTAAVADLICPSGVMVTGRVLDKSTGKPIAGARVDVNGPTKDQPKWGFLSEPSDSRGRYTLRAIPGKAVIQFAGSDGNWCDSVPAEKTVSIPESGLKNVSFMLRSCDLASGKVVDSKGRPVQDVIVQAFMGQGYGPQVLTDTHGDFEVVVPQVTPAFGCGPSAIPADTVVLEAKDMKWNVGIVKLVKRTELLKRGATLTTEPAGTLKVIVKDDKGNPLKGATVYLGLAYGFPKSQSQITDDSGAVTFDHIIKGAVYNYPSVRLLGYSSKGIETPLIAGGKGWKDAVEIVMASP